MADPNTIRIVLLGPTGSGKSSVANTLFGEDHVFQVNPLPNSGTKSCESRTKTINGRSIQLIDTPGFFDTDPRSTELSPELLKCITECAPGPHAFLLVLNMEELEPVVLALTLKYFSEEALKYTTVVFTHGDQLPEGTEIHDYVEQTEDLRNLVQMCGGRCHVVDHEHWNNSQDQYRNNQYQIQQLLQTIDQTVRGGYYTNELLQEITSVENISENHQICSLKDVELGILLGSFLGTILGAGSVCCSDASRLMSEGEVAVKEVQERPELEQKELETAELELERLELEREELQREEVAQKEQKRAEQEKKEQKRKELDRAEVQRPEKEIADQKMTFKEVGQEIELTEGLMFLPEREYTRCCMIGGIVSRVSLVGTAYLAGKLSERWSSPTQAVRDMTQFAKEVEGMFVQWTKTANAAKSFANVASV